MTKAFLLQNVASEPQRVDVEVQLDDQNRKMLRIRGDGIDQTWPVRSIRRVSSQEPDEIWLQLASSDMRLVAPIAGAAELQTQAPEVFRRSGGSGWLALGATLAAIIALLAIALFVLTPMLAGPIARATPIAIEQSYGAATRQMIEMSTKPCDVPEAARAEAVALAEALAKAAQSPFPTDLQFVTAGFPNAFALPGGRIVVTGELIQLLGSPEELAGVMAHETAHVARRHVMQALVRELGGAMVFDLLVGGGAGVAQQIALAGLELQGLSRGRAAETEADELAIDYLLAVDIDPMALALFFDRLKEVEAKAGGRQDSNLSELVSTHPLTARRAETARALAEQAGRPAAARPALSAATWAALKASCGAKQ